MNNLQGLACIYTFHDAVTTVITSIHTSKM